MPNPPSAAQALYPHLPSGERPEVEQRQQSLGDAMWPQLSRAAKAKDADQALWRAILERQRESFRQGMREANARERGRR
jgi:hypothetical protein